MQTTHILITKKNIIAVKNKGYQIPKLQIGDTTKK